MKKDQYKKATCMAIETNFTNLFGDVEDYNGYSYSDVYDSELNGIYDDISDFLHNISDKFETNTDELASILTYRWYLTFGLDDIIKKSMLKVAKSILITIKRTLENPNYI